MTFSTLKENEILSSILDQVITENQDEINALIREAGIAYARKMLKLTDDERYTAAAHYDVVVALDWDNFSRFEDEIGLGPDSWILCDEVTELPVSVLAMQVNISQVPFADLAAACHPQRRPIRPRTPRGAWPAPRPPDRIQPTHSALLIGVPGTPP